MERQPDPPPMTVADLRAVLADLPGEMPIAVRDDSSFDPLLWAVTRRWKWSKGWGEVEHAPEPDDEPGYHEGFTPALVLSASYEP